MLSMAFRSAQKLAFVTVAFILYAIPYTLYASPVHAQAPPDPFPCENPIEPNPEILTHNWMVNENREPEPQSQLHNKIATKAGAEHSEVTAEYTFEFTVNFSQMGALFGPTNSDYNEGEYQQEDHKNANISELDQVDISKYNGPVQKAGNQVMLDALRIKYVDYIWRNPHLQEASDEFTNTNGDNPRSIYEMHHDFGEQLPDLDPNTSNPTPPSYGGNKNDWQDKWGQYWSKIPTSYSEYYKAYIQFRAQHKAYENQALVNNSGNLIDQVLRGAHCPYWIDETIAFVMPEYFRTTATTGQVNQIIVPGAAQSNHSNDVILQNKPESQNSVSGKGNLLSTIIDKCLKAFQNNPVSNALKKVISFVHTNFLSFNVYAEPYFQTGDNPDEDYNLDCIRILVDGKEGRDPYCALPADQPDGDLEYTCTNQIDELKRDKNNPNVICTFKIKWKSPIMKLEQGEASNQFDVCIPHPITPDWVICDVAVSLWPIFEIPWQAEIWNNTLFSDKKNLEPYLGSESQQIKGRPGSYSFFTPITVFEDEIDALLRKCNPLENPNSEACNEIKTLAHDSGNADFKACVERVLLNPEALTICAEEVVSNIAKKRPGETDRGSISDLSRRVIGGTDCSKEYVWHNALYPIAAQQVYGIKNACPVESAAASREHLPPGSGFDPGDIPTLAECADIPTASDGNPDNGIETSVEELECYITQRANGKIERLTGADLPTIMIQTMLGESGGDQCAAHLDDGNGNATAALGVFQYIASTWKENSSFPNVDSGSVRAAPGSTNTCWGSSNGIEPTNRGIYSGDAFNWVVQFGENRDGMAWNPYNQIDVTIPLMERGETCRWEYFGRNIAPHYGVDCGY